MIFIEACYLSEEAQGYVDMLVGMGLDRDLAFVLVTSLEEEESLWNLET